MRDLKISTTRFGVINYGCSYPINESRVPNIGVQEQKPGFSTKSEDSSSKLWVFGSKYGYLEVNMGIQLRILCTLIPKNTTQQLIQGVEMLNLGLNSKSKELVAFIMIS